MSTCNFKKGEMIRCVSPDPFGHYLRGRLYRVWRDSFPSSEYVGVVGEDRQSRTMFKSRFARGVKQTEFTDEEYEGLLV